MYIGGCGLYYSSVDMYMGGCGLYYSSVDMYMGGCGLYYSSVDMYMGGCVWDMIVCVVYDIWVYRCRGTWERGVGGGVY